MKYIKKSNINKSNSFNNYINESNSCNYFSDKFNVSPYDHVFEKPLYYYIAKNITGHIEYISPDNFIKKLSTLEIPISKQKDYLDTRTEHINSLADKMKDGVKIDIPFLIFRNGIYEHEGRHRAMAAKSLGCDKIPVGMFRYIPDKEVVEFIKENHYKSYEELNDMFIKMGFKGITALGFRELSNIFKYRKLYEKDTYDDVLKNDDSYPDKVDKLKVITLDNTKDYFNTKNYLVKVFTDIEEELNNPTIYKKIEDNEFLEKYVILLTRKREQLILQKSIETKKETIEQSKEELSNIASEDTEAIDNLNKDIQKQEEELESFSEKLSEYDLIDKQLNDYDNYVKDLEKNVKQGKVIVPNI